LTTSIAVTPRFTPPSNTPRFNPPSNVALFTPPSRLLVPTNSGYQQLDPTTVYTNRVDRNERISFSRYPNMFNKTFAERNDGHSDTVETIPEFGSSNDADTTGATAIVTPREDVPPNTPNHVQDVAYNTPPPTPNIKQDESSNHHKQILLDQDLKNFTVKLLQDMTAKFPATSAKHLHPLVIKDEVNRKYFVKCSRNDCRKFRHSPALVYKRYYQTS
jgi:hypothetical protein